jgi:4-hydroxy-3-methylbut-2-enyl diphosphate reductase IspH
MSNLKVTPKEEQAEQAEIYEPYKIEVVTGDFTYLHEALGISEERHNELNDKVIEIMEKNDSTTAIAIEVSKECNSMNELASTMILLGRRLEHNNSRLNMFGGFGVIGMPRPNAAKNKQSEGRETRGLLGR